MVGDPADPFLRIMDQLRTFTAVEVLILNGAYEKRRQALPLTETEQRLMDAYERPLRPEPGEE